MQRRALRRPRLRPARRRRGEPRGLPHDHPGPAQRPALRGPLPFVPESLIAAFPPLNPDAPELRGLEAIGANILVVTRAQVDGRRARRSRCGLLRRQRAVDAGRGATPAAPTTRASSRTRPRTTSWRSPSTKGVARTRSPSSPTATRRRQRRAKELYIVDYDGFNPRRVTVNNSLNILPAWSPDGRSLAYVSYRQGVARPLRRPDLRGTERRTSPAAQGQAFAPAFSPDGKRIAYASNQQRQHGHLGRERGRHRRRTASRRTPGQRHRALLEPDRAGDRVHLRPRAARRRST